MVTLQQYKEKLNSFIEENFYSKNQINDKENILNNLINEKANKSNATQSNAGLMSAEDKIKLDSIENLDINIEVVNDIENVENDGIYLIHKDNNEM